MVFPEPILNGLLERPCQNEHLPGLLSRNGSRPLIIADIALLAECVELGDENGVGPYSKGERLNDPVMMAVSYGAVSGRRQGRRSRLQRRIVGDRQAPVRTQPRGLAFAQVPLGDSQKVRDLFGACFVRDEPAVSEPTVQAHSRPRSDKSSAH